MVDESVIGKRRRRCTIVNVRRVSGLQHLGSLDQLDPGGRWACERSAGGSHRYVRGHWCVLLFVSLLLWATGCPVPPDDPPGTSIADTDNDGLTDEFELRLGTDPLVADTDGDGLADGVEIDETGTSPLDDDSDGDGLIDGEDAQPSTSNRGDGSISFGNDVEPNDSFAGAVVLENINQTDRTYYGQIDLVGDVDVFDLGAMTAGDRIVVDRDPISSDLKISLAIFDGEEALFSVILGSFNASGNEALRVVEETVRHDSDHYYLAITHSTSSVNLGAYRIDVAVERDAGVVPPSPQTIFLDFDGATFSPPILGEMTVPPFDAAAIHVNYADDTELIKTLVIETVRRRYLGVGVTVVTSDELDAVPDGNVTTLFIGGFNDTVFGVADGVDEYNMNQCDDGIIFSESFGPDVFGFLPPAVKIGLAIGQVVAHEAGHLLGLNHVTDATALMDEKSPAPTLLQEQLFKVAPMAESIFAIGVQDAPRLLLDIVGAG
ncbi:MAG: matrixin family metalloprotease [Planctomycetes bacterium]|nr:matrixin family metalloprotease [Planctomycetota bacterium]